MESQVVRLCTTLASQPSPQSSLPVVFGKFQLVCFLGRGNFAKRCIKSSLSSTSPLSPLKSLRNLESQIHQWSPVSSSLLQSPLTLTTKNKPRLGDFSRYLVMESDDVWPAMTWGFQEMLGSGKFGMEEEMDMPEEVWATEEVGNRGSG